MNIQIEFKTPDAVYYACAGLTKDEARDVREVAEKYVRHGELITIILNTETETCVIERVR